MRGENRLLRAKLILDDALAKCPGVEGAEAELLDVLPQLGARKALTARLAKIDADKNPQLGAAVTRAKAWLAQRQPEANSATLVASARAARKQGREAEARALFDRAAVVLGGDEVRPRAEVDGVFNTNNLMHWTTDSKSIGFAASFGVTIGNGDGPARFVRANMTSGFVPNADGSLVATGGSGIPILVFRTDTSELVQTLGADATVPIGFVGDKLAVKDGRARVDMISLKDARRTTLSTDAHRIMWSGDRARYLVARDDADDIELRRSSDNAVERTWHSPNRTVVLAIDKTGDHVAVKPMDSPIWVSSRTDPRMVTSNSSVDREYSMAFTADGRTLRVVERNEEMALVREVDTSTGQLTAGRPLPARGLISPDAESVAMLSTTGAIIDNARTGQRVRAIRMAQGKFIATTLAPSGTLTAADTRGVIRTWAAATNTTERTFSGAPGARVLGFSKEGTRAVLADETSIYVGDVQSAQAQRVGALTSRPIVADMVGDIVVAGGEGGQACVFSTKGGSPKCVEVASKKPVQDVALDSSGTRLVTASDTDVAVWEVAAAKRTAAQSGKGVVSARFIGDERTIMFIDERGMKRWALDSQKVSDENPDVRGSSRLVVGDQGLLLDSGRVWDANNHTTVGIDRFGHLAAAFAAVNAPLKNSFVTATNATLRVYTLGQGGAQIRLTILNASCGDVAVDDSGYFDAPPACRTLVGCGSGVPLPTEACDDRYVQGLAGKVLAGDRSYADP